MKNYQLLLFSGFWFFIVAQIGTGKYTHMFASDWNEMGCVVIALTLGVISLLAVNWKKFGMWLLSY
jgi:hypothetical protein